jgi:hypothetical protein
MVRLFVSALRDLFRSRASLGDRELCAASPSRGVETAARLAPSVAVLARPNVLGRPFQGPIRLAKCAGSRSGWSSRDGRANGIPSDPLLVTAAS